MLDSKFYKFHYIVQWQQKTESRNSKGWTKKISIKEIIFKIFCLVPRTSSPFWKESYSIRKEFAPSGSKFFPYRVDPFLESDKKDFERVTPLKVYHFVMLSTLGKNFSRHYFEIFKKIHFGDNMNKMSKHIFLGKKKENILSICHLMNMSGEQ